MLFCSDCSLSWSVENTFFIAMHFFSFLQSFIYPQKYSRFVVRSADPAPRKALLITSNMQQVANPAEGEQQTSISLQTNINPRDSVASSVLSSATRNNTKHLRAKINKKSVNTPNTDVPITFARKIHQFRIHERRGSRESEEGSKQWRHERTHGVCVPINRSK